MPTYSGINPLPGGSEVRPLKVVVLILFREALKLGLQRESMDILSWEATPLVIM